MLVYVCFLKYRIITRCYGDQKVSSIVPLIGVTNSKHIKPSCDVFKRVTWSNYNFVCIYAC